MQPWTVEYGTLWAAETKGDLRPLYPARVGVVFAEASPSDGLALTGAMNLSDPQPIQQRFQSHRRCFTLRVADHIISYGWVTHGTECVGEFERQFRFHDDEAYIWDCATVPAWRGRGCYSALLSHILHQLQAEGMPRVWIGASRLNQPSVKGFVNAGFQPVVDATYRRFYRLTWLWIHPKLAVTRPLVGHAYRILLNDHERRFGRLALGYKRKRNNPQIVAA